MCLEDGAGDVYLREQEEPLLIPPLKSKTQPSPFASGKFMLTRHNGIHRSGKLTSSGHRLQQIGQIFALALNSQSDAALKFHGKKM